MTADDWPPLPDSIQTPRSLLRRFSAADADDVYAYRRDPEVVRFLRVAQPFERRDADAFVATQVLADPRERCVWALEQQGRVVGGVSLRIARQRLRAELGYELARWLWSRGLMAEATSAVVDAAFRRLPIIKISATATATNTRSIRLLKKLGMQHEALLRQHWVHRGRVLDEVRYGLLRDEWEEQQAANTVP
ncbi:MAG: GNAT family N-acetyltransferase [Chloroflexi bacterium]|nr:GNAT family N-acetyltransferase [Chloroflexota bacterium]